MKPGVDAGSAHSWSLVASYGSQRADSSPSEHIAMSRPILVFVVAVLALVSVVLAAVVMVSRISFLQG